MKPSDLGRLVPVGLLGRMTQAMGDLAVGVVMAASEESVAMAAPAAAVLAGRSNCEPVGSTSLGAGRVLRLMSLAEPVV